jgi:hypothetical protein
LLGKLRSPLKASRQPFYFFLKFPLPFASAESSASFMRFRNEYFNGLSLGSLHEVITISEYLLCSCSQTERPFSHWRDLKLVGAISFVAGVSSQHISSTLFNCSSFCEMMSQTILSIFMHLFDWQVSHCFIIVHPNRKPRAGNKDMAICSF